MNVLSLQHVTRNRHAVRHISKFYKLGDLTGSVLQQVSDTVMCPYAVPTEKEQKPG